MSKVNVFDTSAVLAHLQQEKGRERVEAALEEGSCLMSTVNLCEVLGKLCEKGMPEEEARITVDELGLTIVNFDSELAAIAAFLKVRTKPLGASLGDRACLALAQQAKQNKVVPVVITAEHAWTRIGWPFKIAVIR